MLRLKPGDGILVFNGRDGEWRAELADAGKRGAALLVRAAVRPQEGGPDIDYLFAPLKRARLDYLVQKATEMGVARLRPVLTHRTTPERVNVERMRANAIEAAEQCGILRIPEVGEPEKLDSVAGRLGRDQATHLLRRGQRGALSVHRIGAPAARPARVADRTRGRFRRGRACKAARPAIRDGAYRSGPASCAPTRPPSPLSPS